MNTSRNCEGCYNDAELLINSNSDAYFFCRATIGEAYFQNYGRRCLACALLAEASQRRPASASELQYRFSSLSGPGRDSSPAPTAAGGGNGGNEGHDGFIFLA